MDWEMIMEERPLVLAVIDACLLLELCGEDDITQEKRTWAMSDISDNLLRLAPAEQVALRDQLAGIAHKSPDPTYSTFIAGLADRLGLARPSAGPDPHLSWR
jgi:hypothetical protein